MLNKPQPSILKIRCVICVIVLLWVLFLSMTIASAQQGLPIAAQRLVPFLPRLQVGSYVPYTQAQIDATPIPVREYRTQFYLGVWFVFLPPSHDPFGHDGEWFYWNPQLGWLATSPALYDPGRGRSLSLQEVLSLRNAPGDLGAPVRGPFGRVWYPLEKTRYNNAFRL